MNVFRFAGFAGRRQKPIKLIVFGRGLMMMWGAISHGGLGPPMKLPEAGFINTKR